MEMLAFQPIKSKKSVTTEKAFQGFSTGMKSLLTSRSRSKTSFIRLSLKPSRIRYGYVTDTTVTRIINFVGHGYLTVTGFTKFQVSLFPIPGAHYPLLVTNFTAGFSSLSEKATIAYFTTPP